MVLVCHRHIWAVTALLLLCHNIPGVEGNAVTTVTSAPSTVNTAPATCEFRTINYITASLPQQCLRSAWSSTNATSTKTDRAEDGVTTGTSSNEAVTTSSAAISQNPGAKTDGIDIQRHESSAPADLTSSTPIPAPSSTETGQPTTVDPESGELNEAAFLSFEEWKKQTLEKAGQANENIGNRKSSGPGQKRDPEGTQNNFDSLGDEGEIELDFGAFRSGGGDEDGAQATQMNEPEKQQDPQTHDGSKKQKDIYRSKDAGKTYKERFSYASFDGGATVLKTHPGAKNAKAVLVENKDSYMLSECATENKFLIIELSEDIWIDTLVLANYEFFSSMIRTFRVSVSDRYPVKMEKWKDLGTYEARNSREIQAFLVENPQIWARYIRIEFLSHYGNEYYCPLSLVRVHGTRMLESWKESEAIGNEEDAEDNDDQGIEEHFIPDAVAVVVQEEEKLIAELKEAQAALQNITHDSARNTSEQAEANLDSPSATDLGSYSNSSIHEMMDPWTKPDSLLDIFDQLYSSNKASIICQLAEAPTTSADTQVMSKPETDDRSVTERQGSTTSTAPAAANATSLPSNPVTQNITDTVAPETSTDAETVPVSTETVSATSSGPDISSSIPSSVTSRSQEAVSGQKNKTTSTSSAPSSLPTIQESFFNAVSRRLQLLESNSTLSLKYIEEQSKILREAFTKVEKKQLQKTDAFLESLNSTVLEQLRGFRQQYDEIWQSTVISLESQRDESKREILAVSTRLNILADEVIFQKRMSIVQSVLLLLCLGLVIFSRVSSGGALDFQSMQARARNSVFQTSPAYSPPESPSLRQTTSMGIEEHRQWLDSRDGERAADGYTISRLRSRDDSPPTPVSSYSRSDNNLTPPSGGDDPLTASADNRISSSSDYADPSSQSTAASPQPNIWLQRSDGLEPTYLSPSSAGTHRRREGITTGFNPPSGNLHGHRARDSQSSLESRGWTGQEIRSENRSAHLPSPPPEAGNEARVYISRKPLPDLPPHDD